MIGENSLVKGFNTCSEEIGLESFRDENVVNAGGTTSVCGRVIFDAMSSDMAIDEAAS